jgi:hypothetical protein
VSTVSLRTGKLTGNAEQHSTHRASFAKPLSNILAEFSVAMCIEYFIATKAHNQLFDSGGVARLLKIG